MGSYIRPAVSGNLAAADGRGRGDVFHCKGLHHRRFRLCVKKEHISVSDAQRSLGVCTKVITGGNLQVVNCAVEIIVTLIREVLDCFCQLFIVGEQETPLRNRIFGILNHGAV